MGFKSLFERGYGLLMANFVWEGVPLIWAAERKGSLTYRHCIYISFEGLQHACVRSRTSSTSATSIAGEKFFEISWGCAIKEVETECA